MMKMTFLRISTILCATSFAAASPTAGSGTGATVKASSFGFDPEDSTAFLQSAVDSAATRVVVDRMPSDWIVGPVVVSNGCKEIIFEDGVVLRAKKDSFHGVRERLLSVWFTSNVTVRGEGRVTFAMNKADYDDPAKYRRAEQRDCIVIHTSRNTSVSNLVLRSSGGDGIEITDADGVMLEDIVCEDNYRQGLSINSGENMMVRRCSFRTTGGHWPMCGVDLEPFRRWHPIRNILFEDCSFDENRASGIDLHLSGMSTNSPDVFVTFRRCHARNNRFFGIQMYSTWNDAPVKGVVRFEECEFSGNGHAPMRIVNQIPDGLDICFRNCVFDARGASQGYGLYFNNERIMNNVSGVRFWNSKLLLDESADPILLKTMTGFGMDGVSGNLIVERNGHPDPFCLSDFVASNAPNPSLVNEFRACPVDYRKLSARGGRMAGSVATPPMTGSFVFLQQVPSAGEYPVMFRPFRTGKGEGKIRVQVRDRWGTDMGEFTVPDSGKQYSIKAGGEGLFRFEVNVVGDRSVRVVSSWIGQGVQCDDYIRVVGVGGESVDHTAYFRVPGAASEIVLEIDSPTHSSATIRDGSGEVAGIFKRECRHQVFKFDRQKSGRKAETWSIRFDGNKGTGNFGYRIGGDVLPVASFSPECVIGDK